MYNIEKQEWDSEFFNLNIGKVEIQKDESFHFKEFKNQISKKNYDLIYIVSIDKMLSNDILNDTKIVFTDIIITMIKNFNKEEYLDIPYKFKVKLSPKKIQECYHIAEQVSIVSRFNKESLIGSEKTKHLYKKWIDNTLNKSFSDGLFIESKSNVINGIHIIKTNQMEKIGYFSLTGVRANNKNSGIGSKLWMQSMAYWANESDINFIKSPFSFQNKDSFNFHLKHGFNKILNVKYLYHFKP